MRSLGSRSVPAWCCMYRFASIETCLSACLPSVMHRTYVHAPLPPNTHPTQNRIQTIVRDRLAAAKNEIRTGLGPKGEGYVVLRDFLRNAAPGEGGQAADRLCRNMRSEALALFKCVSACVIYGVGIGFGQTPGVVWCELCLRIALTVFLFMRIGQGGPLLLLLRLPGK